MAEAKQNKVDQANISKENNENPPDLLKRLSQEKTHKENQFSNAEEPEEPDLNLRLSLGGIYNEVNTKEKPLTRSSSIIGVITLNKKSNDTPLPNSFLSLSRSCSLPVEQKKVNVKEKLQAVKRVEAIKMAMEKKQRSGRGTNEKEKSPQPEKPPSSPSKVVAWAAASVIKSRAFCRAIVKIKEDNKKLAGLKELAAVKRSSSSKSSSEPKDSEPAVTSGTEANGKSVKAAESMLENPSKKAKVSNGIMQSNGMDVMKEMPSVTAIGDGPNGRKVEMFPSKKAKVSNGIMQSNGMDVMKQMPSVTAIGDGPNGRKVEGFLYRYMKGQVSIVCVCHGNFLSPAEFVKHAGGKDVTNPMKHINVCPTSFSY